MVRHVLVGGGTGFIGRHLTNCLSKNGYEVTKISRMPGERTMTWYDLEKYGLPRSVSAVVNVAGQNVLDPLHRWTDSFKKDVILSRVNTTRVLADAIEKSETVDVFVSISGVSHYKPTPNKTYTEKDDVSAFDFMSKLCIDWEHAADTAALRKRCRVVKIRSGVVVGRGGGMIQSIWWPFQLGVGGPLGSGDQILPWIHMKDLCRMIIYALENDYVEGVLNGVAPEIVTNGQFSQTFASILRRPCLFPLPEFIVKALFGNDRSTLLLSGAKISPVRVKSYGFSYNYPTVKDALQEVVYGKRKAIT